MPFYVYGRDRKTGEAAHRFLSHAGTPQAARAEGEARGIEVNAVVAAHAHENSEHTQEPPATSSSHSPEPKQLTDALDYAAPVRVMPALIVANVLWFAAMSFGGGHASADALLQWGASYGPVTIGHQWWRLLSANFVHVGVIDLVIHMVALGYVGWAAERQYGNAAFALICLIAGIGGNLVAQQTDALGIVTSATALVCGCIGALLALTVWRRGELSRAPQTLMTREDIELAKEVPQTLMISAVVAIFVIAEFGFELSFSALIGGLVCGFACGLALAPLAEQDAGTKRRRLVGTVVTAAVLLGFTGAWVHAKNRGLNGKLVVLDAATALDQRVSSQLSQARAEWQNCKLQSADVASLVQRQILPDVRAVRSRLEQLAPYPTEIAAEAALKLKALKQREADMDTPSPTAKWSPDAGTPRSMGNC
jgi:rhomboid protease GluP